MYLSTDGRDLNLKDRTLTVAEYTGGQPPSFRLFAVDEVDGKVAEKSLRMAPWAPEGFRVYDWHAVGGLVLCGAQQLRLLEAATLETKAAIPLEYGECETGEFPLLQEADDLLMVTTETRVFCMDARLAIRWIWTVKVHSDEWWKIESTPTIETGGIRLRLRSPKREAEVALSLDDGSALLEGSRPGPSPA